MSIIVRDSLSLVFFTAHLVFRTPRLLVPLLVEVVAVIWLNGELVVWSHIP